MRWRPLRTQPIGTMAGVGTTVAVGIIIMAAVAAVRRAPAILGGIIGLGVGAAIASNGYYAAPPPAVYYGSPAPSYYAPPPPVYYGY